MSTKIHVDLYIVDIIIYNSTMSILNQLTSVVIVR